MNKTNITIIAAALFATIIFVQCKHDKGVVPTTGTPTITDDALFAETNTTTGYTYYKNNTAVLAKSNPSPHTSHFRVRFNATALAALTDNGKLPTGSSFPEGSVIVKELHDNASGNSINGIAIMKKSSTDPNAAENGWVWAEYFGNATSGIKVSSKGVGCNGCHSNNVNRDKVRLFDLFP